MNRLLLAPALVALCLGSATGCGSDSFSDTGVPPAPAQPTESPDAAAPEVDASLIVGEPPKAPPGCDGDVLPTVNPCVVDEGLGVFVSKSLGNDTTGNGTRATPFATIQKAINVAAPNRKRVYACAEAYKEETITLAEGVSIFGYFDCAKGWALGTGMRAQIEGTAIAGVKATNLTAPIQLEALAITGPITTPEAPSSFGIIANNVKDLRIVGSTIVAKNAAGGADGADAAQLSGGPDIDGANGKPAFRCLALYPLGLCQASSNGSMRGEAMCGGKKIVGGFGGNGGVYKQELKFVGPQVYKGVYAYSPSSDGEGGTADIAAGGGGNAPGKDGNPGMDGVAGLSSQGGFFSVNGWQPGDGTKGADGAPGQGGGGGAGVTPSISEMPDTQAYYGGDGGAGGGAGGCPGIAATPGKGGGSSVALLAWNSGIRLEGTSLQAGDGGDGGMGAKDAAPTNGGRGGVASRAAQPSTRAGAGGRGGNAGVSGHGAGGASIGVAFKGASPNLGGATPKVGVAGNGQAVRSFHSTGDLVVRTIPASADGFVAAIYPIP